MKSNLIFGIHPILEAIASQKTFDKVFIQNGLQSENIRKLKLELHLLGIHINYVPLEKLNRITTKNHQGIVAFMSPISFYSIEELLPTLFENKKNPLLLLLDKITDVRNFGAITRTAESVGVDAVIIGNSMAAPISEDSMKTSAGALNHIKVCKEKNLTKTVEFLQQSGLKIVCATEKSNALLYDEDLSVPLVLVLGSEEEGISKSILDIADANVKLPMFGNTQSLNVSVACGAMLYEIIRQRITK